MAKLKALVAGLLEEDPGLLEKRRSRSRTVTPGSSRKGTPKWRFLLWTQKASQFAGIQGLQPVLARMVWSLNILHEQGLPKSRYRFAVCEIGGDWSWFRFLWQFDQRWNGLTPCPFCNVKKSGSDGYSELKEIQLGSTIDFFQFVGTGDTRKVNPLVLLKNFHGDLVQPCQLHNLHLGLLWTSNSAAVATFAELGYFGNPSDTLGLLLENAWDDFKCFLKQEKRLCSQSKFTIKMILKKSHGGYFSAKGRMQF